MDPFVDTRDDEHPVRWTGADGAEVKYVGLEEAVRRIARTYDKPNAEAIQASLLRGEVHRTDFAFYVYEDPS